MSKYITIPKYQKKENKQKENKDNIYYYYFLLVVLTLVTAHKSALVSSPFIPFFISYNIIITIIQQ